MAEPSSDKNLQEKKDENMKAEGTIVDKMTEAKAGQTSAPPKLYDDPVTGEKISKSELKRREKHREAEKRRAEKQATLPVIVKKAVADDQLSHAQYFDIRSSQIEELRVSRNPNPYPHKFHSETDPAEFIAEYSCLVPGETLKDRFDALNQKIRIGARIMRKRKSGKHLAFYDCKTEGKTIQIMCDDRNATGEAFNHNLFHRGDWIGVVGYPGRTNPKNAESQSNLGAKLREKGQEITKGKEKAAEDKDEDEVAEVPHGELSVYAQELYLLSPCLRLIPNVLQHQETRYRQRYLDLIVNDEPREILITRSKIISYLRRFLEDEKFLEVQTPMMNYIPGGAIAKPFKTYHNDLKRELFLRVAPELNLKMLLVGGLERVFEIGRQFRNEDIDATHNPEFTSCEFYWTFADVYDVMDLTERLLSGMVKDVINKSKKLVDEVYKTELEVKSKDEEGNEKMKRYDIDWARPWKRIEMMPELEAQLGVKFPADLESEETIALLEELLKKHNLHCDIHTTAKMIDKLVGEFIEPKCINPTFITRHPQLMSPLAKPDRDQAGLCERFELFCAGKELCNAYTELNDPKIQRELFEKQAGDRLKGDDEAAVIDETFCRALEYGLPPCAGWGLGIDRLVMFLTDNYKIQEVLTFPLQKIGDEVEFEGEGAEKVVGKENGKEGKEKEVQGEKEAKDKKDQSIWTGYATN